jgi:starch phosphorylase
MPAGDAAAAELHRMQRGEALSGAVNSYTYGLRIPKTLPAGDYTPRIVPALEGARVPIEAGQILWYH